MPNDVYAQSPQNSTMSLFQSFNALSGRTISELNVFTDSHASTYGRADTISSCTPALTSRELTISGHQTPAMLSRKGLHRDPVIRLSVVAQSRERSGSAATEDLDGSEASVVQNDQDLTV